MRNVGVTIVTVLVSIVLFSCENLNIGVQRSEIIIAASFDGDSPETKTAISEVTSEKVKFTWLSGDAINVFFGATDGGIFVTDSNNEVARFKGTIGAVTGGGDDLSGETGLWGVYPYDRNTVCDGSSITLTLPHKQDAKADNLADDLFPSVARSTNFVMAFNPICGSISFKVSSDDIVKVTLSGNDNEKLAGKAKVSMELGGKPEVEDVSDGQTVLSMTAPDGGCFEPGKSYYFVFYPSDFEKGLTLTYYKKDSYASFVYNNAYPVKRNEFGSISAKDGSLTFVKTDGHYIDEYGINHGPGVEIGGVFWAPVNCGYHASDYKWGKLYQLGRKYGQGYSGILFDINGNGVGEYSDASIPIIENNYISIIGGNLIKNQQIYYSDNSDWAFPPNDQAWNAGTQDSPLKTVYDPCPKGWRLPTLGELKALVVNYSPWTTHENQPGRWFSGPYTYRENVPQVFFPAAGCYESTGASKRGKRGGYWSSDYSGTRACDIYFSPDNINIYDEHRSDAYSVRCVYDINAYNVEGKDPEEITDFSISALTFASSSIKIFEGDVTPLAGMLLPIDATYYDITWGSNTPSVATVDNCGHVSGLKAGEAVITATVGGVSATCSVIVSKPLKYIDEYGLDHGAGTAVGITVWAPVNCGYHEVDYPYGKLYQWGRKYGQGYSDEYDKAPEIVKGAVSLDEGQNPDNANRFYTSWTNVPKTDLWNFGTSEDPQKSSYDPCPKGWRLPTWEELAALVGNYSPWMTHEGQPGRWLSGPYNYQEDVPQVFFPAAGMRSSDSMAYARDYEGSYWFSDHVGYMSLISTYRPVFVRSYRTCSVRCVQE